MRGLYPKIMLLVGSVFAVAMVAILAFVYTSESQQIEREGLARAETLNRMAFETLYASMRQGGGREGNRQVIARLQEMGAFTELRVVKGAAVVRQFGAGLGESARDDLDRQALAGEEVRQVRLDDGYRVVRYVTPLWVQAECQRCHQAQIEEINGVISTEVSLREYEQVLRSRLTILLFALGGGVLALGLLTFYALQRLVIRPLQIIQGGAATIAQGAFSHRLQVRTGDELEALAGEFNAMAEHLQELYSSLEQKVAERTRELAALNQVAATANRSLKLDEVLNSALDKVLEIMKVEAGEIFLMEEKGRTEYIRFAQYKLREHDGELHMAAHRGLFPESFRQITCFKLGEGFPGRVAQTGESLITTELAKDLRYLRRQVIEAGFGSFACVPLRAKGKVVGTIDVAALGCRPFSHQEIDLLTNIGNQLGLAIENARLYQAEQSQRQLADMLRQAAQALSATLDLDQVLHTLLDQLSQVLVMDAVLILLREGDALRVAAVRGRPELGMERLLGHRLSLSASRDFCRVLEEKRVLTFCQPGRRPPFAEGFRPIEEVDWCMVVPLLRGEEVIGLLALEQLDHCYNEEQEPQIAFAFANHAAIAIENARLYAQIKALNADLESRVEERMRELYEAKEALAQLLNKTIHIQEEERDRIARDIHDGITQLVIGALYEMQAAKVALAARPDIVVEKLEKAQEALKKAKTEMRRIIYDLHPFALESAGLVPALKEYTASCQELTGILYDFRVIGVPCRLPRQREIAVYRIVQEALQNVAAHADARTLQVALHFGPTELMVIVQDDGQGFDEQTVLGTASKHLGLIGMRERAQSIGSTLEVWSRVGEGTRVGLNVPMSQKS